MGRGGSLALILLCGIRQGCLGVGFVFFCYSAGLAHHSSISVGFLKICGRLLCFAACLHIVISADYLFKRISYLTCNFHLYEVIWL